MTSPFSRYRTLFDGHNIAAIAATIAAIAATATPACPGTRKSVKKNAAKTAFSSIVDNTGSCPAASPDQP